MIPPAPSVRLNGAAASPAGAHAVQPHAYRVSRILLVWTSNKTLTYRFHSKMNGKTNRPVRLARVRALAVDYGKPSFARYRCPLHNKRPDARGDASGHLL